MGWEYHFGQFEEHIDKAFNTVLVLIAGYLTLVRLWRYIPEKLTSGIKVFDFRVLVLKQAHGKNLRSFSSPRTPSLAVYTSGSALVTMVTSTETVLC